MIRLNRYKKHGQRNYVCRCTENDIVVREGLAYSPADMARLTERGMPVNSINTGKAFIDGEENPSFHVTSDRQRFVDVADLWEEHQIIRDKARAANKARNKSKQQKIE